MSDSIVKFLGDSMLQGLLYLDHYANSQNGKNGKLLKCIDEKRPLQSDSFNLCTSVGHLEAIKFVGYAKPALLAQLLVPHLVVSPFANLKNDESLPRLLDDLIKQSNLEEVTQMLDYWEKLSDDRVDKEAAKFERVMFADGSLFSAFSTNSFVVDSSNYYKQWQFSSNANTLNDYFGEFLNVEMPEVSADYLPTHAELAALYKHRTKLVAGIIEKVKPLIEAAGNNPFLWWQVCEHLATKLEANIHTDTELWFAIGGALANIPSDGTSKVLRDLFKLEYAAMTESLDHSYVQHMRNSIGADSLETLKQKVAADQKFGILWARVWRHFVVKQAQRYIFDFTNVADAEKEFLEVTLAAKKARVNDPNWGAEVEIYLHAFADYIVHWGVQGGVLSRMLFEHPTKIVDLEGALDRIHGLEELAHFTESLASSRMSDRNIYELVGFIYFEAFVASYVSVGLFETALKNLQSLSRFNDTNAFKAGIAEFSEKWPWLVSSDGTIDLKGVNLREFDRSLKAANRTGLLFTTSKRQWLNLTSKAVPMLLCSPFGKSMSALCGATGKFVFRTINSIDTDAQRLLNESRHTGISLVSDNLANSIIAGEVIDWAMLYPTASFGYPINRFIMSAGRSLVVGGYDYLVKLFSREAFVNSLGLMQRIFTPVKTINAVSAKLAEKGLERAAQQSVFGYFATGILKSEFRAALAEQIGAGVDLLAKGAGAGLMIEDYTDGDGFGDASGYAGLALFFGSPAIKLLKAAGQFIANDWVKRVTVARLTAIDKGIISSDVTGNVTGTLLKNVFTSFDTQSLGALYEAFDGYMRMGVGAAMLTYDWTDDGELNSIVGSLGVGLLINEVYGGYVMGWNARGGMVSLLGMVLFENAMLLSQNFPFTAPPFAYMFGALMITYTLRGINKQFVFGMPNVGKSYLFRQAVRTLAKHNVRIPISVVGRKSLPARNAIGVMNVHEIPAGLGAEAKFLERRVAQAAMEGTFVPNTTVGVARFTENQLGFYDAALKAVAAGKQSKVMPKLLTRHNITEESLRAEYFIEGKVSYYARGGRVALIPEKGDFFYSFKMKKNGVLFFEQLPKNIVQLETANPGGVVRVVRYGGVITPEAGKTVPFAKIETHSLDAGNSYVEGGKKYFVNIDPEAAPTKIDKYLSNTTYPTHADRPFHKGVRGVIAPFKDTKVGGALYNFWETKVGTVATNAARSSAINRVRGGIAQSSLLPLIYNVRFAGAALQQSDPNETASAAASSMLLTNFVLYTYLQMPLRLDTARASIAGYTAGALLNYTFFGKVFPTKKSALPYFDNDTFISDSFLKKIKDGQYQAASDRMYEQLSSLNVLHYFANIPFAVGITDEPAIQLADSNRQIEWKRLEAYRKQLMRMTRAANAVLNGVKFPHEEKPIDFLRAQGRERYSDAINAFLFADSVLQRSFDMAIAYRNGRGSEFNIDRLKMLLIDIAMLKIFARNSNFNSVNWYYKEVLDAIGPIIESVPELNSQTSLRMLALDLDSGKIPTNLLELDKSYFEAINHQTSDLMELEPIFNSTDK